MGLTKIVSPDISHQACPKMCRLLGCAEHKLSSEQALHIQSENCLFSLGKCHIRISFCDWVKKKSCLFQGEFALALAGSLKIIAKMACRLKYSVICNVHIYRK